MKNLNYLTRHPSYELKLEDIMSNLNKWTPIPFEVPTHQLIAPNGYAFTVPVGFDNLHDYMQSSEINLMIAVSLDQVEKISQIKNELYHLILSGVE